MYPIQWYYALATDVKLHNLYYFKQQPYLTGESCKLIAQTVMAISLLYTNFKTKAYECNVNAVFQLLNTS